MKRGEQVDKEKRDVEGVAGVLTAGLKTESRLRGVRERKGRCPGR